MHDAMVFSRRDQYFQALANPFKMLIKFELRISPHISQIFRDHLAYIGFTFMQKDGKSSYKQIRETSNAIINLR